MNCLRLASWLYVMVATLVFPLLALDLAGVAELTTLWLGLGLLSIPLMVMQTIALHRVLRARAPEQSLRALLYWSLVLQILAVLMLMAAAGLFFWGSWESALWIFLIGMTPLVLVSVASGVVALLLGLKLLKYPDALFGLQPAFAISVVLFGALELANIFLMFTLPIYLVVALAVAYLYAWIIEGHARTHEPHFSNAPLWLSYAIATVAMLIVPMVAIGMGLSHLLEYFRGIYT